MSYCIVFGCNNRVAKKNHEQLENERAKNKKFSFHVFPQNIEKRNKWLEAINLKNYTPPKTSAVCSAHFREDDYEPGLLCRKLKKDAIPNLLKEESTEYQETESVIENIEHYTVDTSNERNEERMETISSTMADRSTSISPSRIFNSPTKVHLRKVHAREKAIIKRQLAIAQYKRNKLRKKIESFKNLIKELRKEKLNMTADDLLKILYEELIGV